MTNYAVWLVIKFEFWDKFMSKIPQKGPCWVGGGGGGAVLAILLVMNFEYWSKFSGGGGGCGDTF